MKLVGLHNISCAIKRVYGTEAPSDEEIVMTVQEVVATGNAGRAQILAPAKKKVYIDIYWWRRAGRPFMNLYWTENECDDTVYLHGIIVFGHVKPARVISIDHSEKTQLIAFSLTRPQEFSLWTKQEYELVQAELEAMGFIIPSHTNISWGAPEIVLKNEAGAIVKVRDVSNYEYREHYLITNPFDIVYIPLSRIPDKQDLAYRMGLPEYVVEKFLTGTLTREELENEYLVKSLMRNQTWSIRSI